MRCDWNMAKTQIGIVLEFFRLDLMGIWLRHNLKLSYNIFDEMRLEFG